jgi:hypothetical protein
MSNKDLKYKNKYLKYKNKYLDLQSQIGGAPPPIPISSLSPPPQTETQFMNYMVLPDEIQRLLINLNNGSLKNVNKASIRIVNLDILESLKKKLRLNKSVKKEQMFISVPIHVYHPEYLSNEETLTLVKIFIKNIKLIIIPIIEYMQIQSVSEQTGMPVVIPLRYFNTSLYFTLQNLDTPLVFNLKKLQKFILDQDSFLRFKFDINHHTSDNQLHFELLFIFYCILFKQINFPQLVIELNGIKFVSFTRSFLRIIFGLNINIIKILTLINLMNTDITDNEVILLANALEKNTTLSTLEFRYVDFTDEGFQTLVNALEKNTTLTILVLYNCIITNSRGTVLANVLITNTTLRTLNLGSNHIGDIGANALADALNTNKTLTSLNLNGNPISETIITDINNKLKRNALAAEAAAAEAAAAEAAAAETAAAETAAAETAAAEAAAA